MQSVCTNEDEGLPGRGENHGKVIVQTFLIHSFKCLAMRRDHVSEMLLHPDCKPLKVATVSHMPSAPRWPAAA